jgi:hypothetical protein
MTLDIYSRVAPGTQEAAAKRFDELLSDGVIQKQSSVLDN